MSTHTIKGHLYFQQTKYMKTPKFVFSEHDMRSWEHDILDGRVWIREESFTVEVPDNFDPRPGMVASLRAEKKRTQALFAAKVKEIDDRINSLLALEMS
jgi:hypothetical protein